MRNLCTYSLFELEFRNRNGQLELEARSSVGQQEVRAILDQPLFDDMGRALRKALEARIKGEHKKLRDGSEPDSIDQRAHGTDLYHAVITPEIGELLADASGWNRALEKSGGPRGIRLRLIFDPTLPDKASLPWEILHRPRLEKFLGRSPDFPISRSIPGPCAASLLEVRTPVRVLVIAPAPREMLSLDLADEQRRIVAALEERREIDVEVLRANSFECLVETLEHQGPFHILHFMGHARFDDGRGGLCFETQDHKEDLIPGKVLGEHLSRFRTLRLVILNSCNTGTLTSDADGDPFAGVATALLWNGIPAVIANQFGISDEAAIPFTEKLYESLAHGMPVDAAAAAGRLAIYKANYATAEWVTPTVFMQVPDGELKIRGGIPIRLGIRSLLPWGGDLEKRSDPVLNLLDDFQGSRLASPETWNEIIAPKVFKFARKNVQQGHPHVFELAAHSSIAYLLGRCVEVKSGLPISFRQNSPGSSLYWRHDEADPDRGDAAAWTDLSAKKLNGESHHLAVAVSLTHAAAELATKYAQSDEISAGDLIDARLLEEPSQEAVLDGAHAWQLAQELSSAITDWRNRSGPASTLHLFVAAPNTFMFYLGQLAGTFGRTQLYEYAFGEEQVGQYFPSIRLPLPKLGDERSNTTSEETT